MKLDKYECKCHHFILCASNRQIHAFPLKQNFASCVFSESNIFINPFKLPIVVLIPLPISFNSSYLAAASSTVKPPAAASPTGRCEVAVTSSEKHPAAASSASIEHGKCYTTAA